MIVVVENLEVKKPPIKALGISRKSQLKKSKILDICKSSRHHVTTWETTVLGVQLNTHGVMGK